MDSARPSRTHCKGTACSDAQTAIEPARDNGGDFDDFERDSLFQLSEQAKCRSQAYDLYGLHFRPMEERDLEPVRLQRNRPEMMALMTTDHEITQEETRHWFANLPTTSRYWMVEWEGRVVGQINLKGRGISEAESGFMFWDDEFKKGGGTCRAILALYVLAFDSCGLTKLHGVVSDSNKAALQLTRFFGFKEVGCLDVNGRTFLSFELSKGDFEPVRERYAKLFVR